MLCFSEKHEIFCNKKVDGNYCIKEITSESAKKSGETSVLLRIIAFIKIVLFSQILKDNIVFWERMFLL